MDTEERERKQLEKETKKGKKLWNNHKWNRHVEVDNNPCLEESKSSLQCIEENYSKRELCNSHFEAYKTCKKYWHAVMRERIRRGIKPPMPTHDEREKMKKELGINFVVS
ncbi:coiled-coil-helix-coiled-coil-helix domain-containing protein 7-like [Branchiostoma lanceolatum]|uniref:coiled-coil-helix-coiled-coil-helix domain-containing protein 7-like n=1 Tax=Branchiostoma lanceolatum TaxID=7740 RepID=UPI0011330BFF